MILLAAATSADIFAAAMGIRAAGIRFSAVSAAAVVLTGAAALWLAVFLSAAASSAAGDAVPLGIAVYISKAILAFIGVRTLFGDVLSKGHGKHKHSLPDCVRVMTEPSCADSDNSKAISAAEGIAMGLALSADSVFTGISAGITGMPPCLIFIFSVLFGAAALAAGSAAGKFLSDRQIYGFPAGRLGGAILIVLAAML